MRRLFLLGVLAIVAAACSGATTTSAGQSPLPTSDVTNGGPELRVRERERLDDRRAEHQPQHAGRVRRAPKRLRRGKSDDDRGQRARHDRV